MMLLPQNREDLAAQDIRFTSKGDVRCRFVMGPEKQVVRTPLGSRDANIREITAVQRLGSGRKLTWTQDAEGLKAQIPEGLPGKYAAVTFKSMAHFVNAPAKRRWLHHHSGVLEKIRPAT